MDDLVPCGRGRGAELLLAHCAALRFDHLRPPAFERLEALVGKGLARTLVSAPAQERDPRPVPSA
jgi:hypothetical protein